MIDKLEWIKLKDMMPPDEERILVYTNIGDIRILERWSGFWTDLESEGLEDSEILYWMHLPKPPLIGKEK